MEELLIGNDMRVYFDSPLKDQDGNEITAGTVEATLYEASRSFGAYSKGNAVSGGAFALSHEGAGVWSGVLDGSVELTEGDVYVVTVTVTAGTSTGQWDILARARFRQ